MARPAGELRFKPHSARARPQHLSLSDHRPPLEKYLRETLEVHKSIKKIGIRVTASIDGVDEFVTTLRDE